jgi:hypothetical protein
MSIQEIPVPTDKAAQIEIARRSARALVRILGSTHLARKQVRAALDYYVAESGSLARTLAALDGQYGPILPD